MIFARQKTQPGNCSREKPRFRRQLRDGRCEFPHFYAACRFASPASLSAVCQARQTEPASHLIVPVKDTDHKSIANATATVFRWTGKTEPMGLEAVTDGSECATIMAIPAGEMLYLGIRAGQFAATHQMITLNAGENQEQEVILAKPVTSSIQAIRPD